MLGIDPGTRRTGFAVFMTRNGVVECLRIDTIVLPERWSLPRRLALLGQEIQSVLEEYRPSEISIEQAIYAQNVRTALALGQARGVILFASMSEGREIYEYSPREVKRAVTGSGNASKHQVQRMIERLVGGGREFGSDEADAAAIALCHLMRPQTLNTQEKEPTLLAGRQGTRQRTGSRWTPADIERLQKEGRVL